MDTFIEFYIMLLVFALNDMPYISDIHVSVTEMNMISVKSTKVMTRH